MRKTPHAILKRNSQQALMRKMINEFSDILSYILTGIKKTG